MQTKLWSRVFGAFGVFALLCGCGSPYLFPEDNAYLLDDSWGGAEAQRQGVVQGDAGDFRGINAVAPFWVYPWDEGDYHEISYSSDVAVAGGSVYVDVIIGGVDRLEENEPLHFRPGVTQIGGISLDVYVCPNGAGESGSADDVVLTKLEDGTITVVATAEAPEQNLDLDIDVAPGMEVLPTASFNEMK